MEIIERTLIAELRCFVVVSPLLKTSLNSHVIGKITTSVILLVENCFSILRKT